MTVPMPLPELTPGGKRRRRGEGDAGHQTGEEGIGGDVHVPIEEGMEGERRQRRPGPGREHPLGLGGHPGPHERGDQHRQQPPHHHSADQPRFHEDLRVVVVGIEDRRVAVAVRWLDVAPGAEPAAEPGLGGEGPRRHLVEADAGIVEEVQQRPADQVGEQIQQVREPEEKDREESGQRDEGHQRDPPPHPPRPTGLRGEGHEHGRGDHDGAGPGPGMGHHADGPEGPGEDDQRERPPRPRPDRPAQKLPAEGEEQRQRQVHPGRKVVADDVRPHPVADLPARQVVLLVPDTHRPRL